MDIKELNNIVVDDIENNLEVISDLARIVKNKSARTEEDLKNINSILTDILNLIEDLKDDVKKYI